MNTAEVIVVRHGESEWNREGRQQGHLDSGLSARGKAQAEAIAHRLAERSFAALYSSDLGRAHQTAKIIADVTGHTAILDARLRERNLGIFEGLTWPEIEQRYPEDCRSFRTGDPDYVIPNGESARRRFCRTVGCLEEIAGNHAGEVIVIVAHGGVLSGLFRKALGIPLEAPRRFRLWNAGLNTFFFEDGSWTLGSWGDVAHLADIGTLYDT